MEFYMIGPAIGVGFILIVVYLVLEDVLKKKNKDE
jgi:hypothetical protein